MGWRTSFEVFEKVLLFLEVWRELLFFPVAIRVEIGELSV